MTAINLQKAVAFLRETVVLMWNNPFKDDEPEGDTIVVKETDLEYYDPSSLFRSDEELASRQMNPLHLYTEPYSREKG